MTSCQPCLRKLFSSDSAFYGLLILLSSCTTNGHLKLTSVNVTAPPPNTGTSSDAGALNIANVFADSNATTPDTLDLIGDGSNSIGTNCSAPAGANQAPQCACTLYYSTPTTPNIQVDVPVTYQEQNLARCSYSGLPAGVTSFTIAIHLTSTNAYSNSFPINLATIGANFDTTNLANFVAPTRFQCRDIVTIPYMLDAQSKVYDPFQSENPHITYPLDFYTSSIGLSIEAYVDGFANNPGLSNWDCPPILNPLQYLTGSTSDPTSPIFNYISNNKINLTTYSVNALNGNWIIYPPTPGSVNDRSTFYLANQPGRVFTVPVNALIAPGINSGTNAITQFANNPLGYGAPPTPIGTGTGQETCPDSTVPIPANYQWMKLWLFRSTLPQRNSMSSSALLSQVQSLTCNPGDWPITTAANGETAPFWSGCYMDYSDLSNTNNTSVANYVNGNDLGKDLYSITLNNDLGAQGPNLLNGHTVYLADRLMAAGECVRLQNPASMGQTCGTSNGKVLPGPGCSSEVTSSGATLGFDAWEVEMPYVTDSAGYASSSYAIGCGKYGFGLGGSTVYDPFGLCYNQTPNDSPGNEYPAQTPTLTQAGDVVPNNIDQKTGSRFDFLFVVSPPSINTIDMQNSTTEAQSYQPLRYELASDCPSTNPNNCGLPNLLEYNMKLHDVGTNGDPPADNPNAPVVFPVCVLQPKPVVN